MLTKKFKKVSGKVDPAVKDRIILEFTPLIKYIAQKIAVKLPANVELDDLVSSGVIGLIDAIEKYDPTRDNTFKTYAEFRIRGAMLDELRSQDWVPRSVRDKVKLLERTYTRLEQEHGRQVSDEEVAQELEMEMQEFHRLVGQVRAVSVLNLDDMASFSHGDKKSLLTALEGYAGVNPLMYLGKKNLKEIMTRGIEELPEKYRLVLSLYYYEDLNLKEIGEILKVTESRVSQLHTGAILRLRAKLKHHLNTEGFHDGMEGAWSSGSAEELRSNRTKKWSKE